MEDIFKKIGITEDAFNKAFEETKLLNNIPFPEIKAPIPAIPNSPVIETNNLLCEQNKLLQEQLKVLREQNKELVKHANDCEKSARISQFFGWVSFGVGTAIGIAGIILGIVF